MKLAEMTNDQATEAMILIAPAVEHIMQNEKIAGAFSDKVVVPKDATEEEKAKLTEESGKRVISNILKLIPELLTTNKKDVYAIIAAVQGASVAQVGKKSFKDTILAVKDILNDEDLLSFFPSFSN